MSGMSSASTPIQSSAAPITASKAIWSGRRISVELVPRGHAAPAEIVRHPGGAVILPLLDDDTMLLISNRRVAIGRRLLELPAGTRDGDEDPLTTAARELEEETGYRAGRLEAAGTMLTTPGFTDEKLWCFVARDLTPTRMNLDDGEDITVEAHAIADVVAMIDSGVITDAKTMGFVLRWVRHRDGDR